MGRSNIRCVGRCGGRKVKSCLNEIEENIYIFDVLHGIRDGEIMLPAEISDKPILVPEIAKIENALPFIHDRSSIFFWE